jgi:gluconolactonase
MIEKLADGFGWAEGPVWMKEGKYLLFSDVPGNTVHKWNEGGGATVFLHPSGTDTAEGKQGANGLTADAAGRLVLCEHGNRRISRLDGQARITLVNNYQGKRLNSPNDLVFRSNGDLYFTDPPYGLAGKNSDPAKELRHNGVYLFTRRGELKLLRDDLTFPNGLAFSPDEQVLYVAVSDPAKPRIMAYGVRSDDSLIADRVFFDASSLAKTLKGLPDGLKTDTAGNIFATGPGGVLVLSPTGKHLGTINTGVATANCAWGDDGGTLYITANTMLCRVKTSTKGKIP